MRISFLLSLSLFPHFADASVQLPRSGESACYRREYSSEHMRSNPKQHLESMYVLLTNSSPRDENENGRWKSAKVLGLKGGETFANVGFQCEYKPDGTAFCMIECDGGSFSLLPKNESVNLQVTEDYYFPLYRNGANVEDVDPQDVLNFDSRDRDNRLYKLYPAPMSACETKLARISRNLTNGCQ